MIGTDTGKQLLYISAEKSHPRQTFFGKEQGQQQKTFNMNNCNLGPRKN